MNNEIKEKMTIGKAKKILRGFLDKDCYYDTPLYYAIPYLLDYITNLQQENQDLSRMCELYGKSLYNAELTDYKSRIEKAVEYINEMDTQLEVYGDYDILSDNKNDLLNVLNGKE